MKKLFLFASTAVLASTLFLASCSKTEDPAANPSSNDPRARFLANWYIQENSSDYGPSTYNVTVTDSSNSSYIMFAYLYGESKKMYATYSGNNFTFPSQIIAGKSFSGTGTLSNSSRIDMTYLVRTTTSHYDTVRAVLTK